MGKSNKTFSLKVLKNLLKYKKYPLSFKIKTYINKDNLNTLSQLRHYNVSRFSGFTTSSQCVNSLIFLTYSDFITLFFIPQFYS